MNKNNSAHILSVCALLLAAAFAVCLCSCGKAQAGDTSTALSISGASVSLGKDDNGEYQLRIDAEGGQSSVIPLLTATAPSLKACDGALLGGEGGFYLLFPDEVSNGSFMFSRFYSVKDGEPYVAAEGFGMEQTDFYYTAVSESGAPLLAVNLTYEADGSHAAYIYERLGDRISRAELLNGWLAPCDDGEHPFVFESTAGEESYVSTDELDWEVFAEGYTEDSGEQYTRTIIGSPDGSGEFLADGQGRAVSAVYSYLYADLENWKNSAVRYSANGKIGYLNRKTGEPITEAAYTEASEMRDGSALVSGDDGMFYYISADGAELFPDKRFAEACPFEHQGEFARVRLDDGWAILSYKGELELQGYQKLNPLPYSTDIASGVDGAGHAKIISVDLSGISEIEPDRPYTDIDEFIFDFTLAYKDGLAGVVNYKGETLLQPEYKSIEYCSYYKPNADKAGSVLLLQGQNGKYGLVFLKNDEQPENITELEYDSIDCDPRAILESSEQLTAIKNGEACVISLDM